MNTGKTVFAQLIHRESLRDIESCLTAFSNKLYHSGIKQSVPKSTLAEANESRTNGLYHELLINTNYNLTSSAISNQLNIRRF